MRLDQYTKVKAQFRNMETNKVSNLQRYLVNVSHDEIFETYIIEKER